MALVSCSECKSPISSRAKLCPHCGKNRTRRNDLRILGILIVAVPVLMVMFRSTSPAPVDSPVAPPAAPQKAAPTAAEIAETTAENRRVLAIAAYAILLKGSMKNPASFQLDRADLMDNGSICFQYRSRNSFDALVPEQSVRTSAGSSQSTKTWNKECAGKTGRDYSKVRFHPQLAS